MFNVEQKSIDTVTVDTAKLVDFINSFGLHLTEDDIEFERDVYVHYDEVITYYAHCKSKEVISEELGEQIEAKLAKMKPVYSAEYYTYGEEDYAGFSLQFAIPITNLEDE